LKSPFFINRNSQSCKLTMGYYHLTEAYLDLHNPRKLEENTMFYDNIRFVDYLSQADIQEVTESIIWEFMDYGNTFNEAFGIMMESLSDDNVDCFLTEATVTYGHDTRNPSRGVTTGAGRRSYGPVRGRDTQGQIDSASRAARRQERVSRVVGAARKAAKDVESATKGAVRSAKSAAGGAVSGTVNKAKAALKGLLRSGAKTALRAGRNIEKSGQRAERTTAVYGPGYGRGGSTEPLSTTTSGGAKRRAIGGALKSLGKMIKGKPSRPQREATPTRSGASDLARIRGSLDKLRAKREDPWNQPFTPRSKAPESKGSSPTQQKLLPPTKQQKSLPPGRSAPPIPPLPRSAAGSTSSGTSGALPPVGGSSRTPSGGKRKEQSSRGALERAAGRGAKSTAALREYDRLRNQAKSRGIQKESFDIILDLIAEDIVNNGYAHDYDAALNIMESFSTETLYDLIETYDNEF
jgi:hypothetical protein